VFLDRQSSGKITLSPFLALYQDCFVLQPSQLRSYSCKRCVCRNLILLIVINLGIQTLNHKCRHEVTGSYGQPSDIDSTVADENPTAATPLIPNSLPPPPPSVREVLTPRVRIAILNNGAVALVCGYLVGTFLSFEAICTAVRCVLLSPTPHLIHAHSIGRFGFRCTNDRSYSRTDRYRQWCFSSRLFCSCTWKARNQDNIQGRTCGLFHRLPFLAANEPFGQAGRKG
jgi:hypothetical protein